MQPLFEHLRLVDFFMCLIYTNLLHIEIFLSGFGSPVGVIKSILSPLKTSLIGIQYKICVATEINMKIKDYLNRTDWN